VEPGGGAEEGEVAMDGSGAGVGGSIDVEEVVERKGRNQAEGMGYKAIKILGSSTYSGQLDACLQSYRKGSQ
jgi:hypothetical protein